MIIIKLILLLIFILLLGLLIYRLTYPSALRRVEDLSKIEDFPEIDFIENLNLDYKLIKPEISKLLNIEVRFLKSQEANEKMRYIIIRTKDDKDDKELDSEKIPTLIFLHGLRDDASNWINRAYLLENYLMLIKEKKIKKINLILIDSGYDGQSWFYNIYRKKDKNYRNYLTKELFPKLRQEFRGEWGIVGFSMGGFAAYNIALKNLKDFKVIGSFAGAINLVRLIRNLRDSTFFKFFYAPKCFFKNEDTKNFLDVFGPWGADIQKENPYWLIDQGEYSDFKDKYFYLSVGNEDIKKYKMLSQWIDFVLKIKEKGLIFKGNLCLEEEHTWEYVRRDLKNFLIYFDKHIYEQNDDYAI